MRLLALAGLSIWLAAPTAAADPSEPLLPRSHLLLPDVSGSMEKEREVPFLRYSSGLMAKLVAKLLEPDGQYIKRGQPVLVVPFAWEGQPVAARGPFPAGDRERLQGGLPTAADAVGKQTNLEYALTRAQQEIQQKGLAEPVAIWMITDNKPSSPQAPAIEPFYKKLRDTASFREIWFCPLADPQKGEHDALVLYTIVYNRAPGKPALGLMTEAGKRIGYESIVFKPLFTSAGGVLRFSRTVEYLDAATQSPQPERFSDADDRFNLTVPEGEELSGFLRFRVRSELKGWQISRATLEDGKAELNIPDAYEGAQERAVVTWKIGPKKELRVDPQSESVNLYTMNLSDATNPIRLRPRSFWTGVWRGRLPELTGIVRIHATLQVGGGPNSGIQPRLPAALLPHIKGVQNLEKIAQFMTQQKDESGSTGQTRRLGMSRELSIRVQMSPARRLAGLFVMALPILLLAAALVALRLQKDTLLLEGPAGPERIQMALLGDRHELRDERSAGVGMLVRRLQGYRVEPFGGHTVDGSPEPRPLTLDGDRAEFTLVHTDTQRVLRYRLAREEAPPEQSPGEEEA